MFHSYLSGGYYSEKQSGKFQSAYADILSDIDYRRFDMEFAKRLLYSYRCIIGYGVWLFDGMGLGEYHPKIEQTGPAIFECRK
jgi:hypothetical protein